MERKNYDNIRDLWNQGFSLCRNYQEVMKANELKKNKLINIRTTITNKNINWEKFDFILLNAINYDYANYYKSGNTSEIERIHSSLEYLLQRNINLGLIIATPDIDWNQFDILFEKSLENGYDRRIDAYKDFDRKSNNIRKFIISNITETNQALGFSFTNSFNWEMFQEIHTNWGQLCRDGYNIITKYQDILCMLVGKIDNVSLLQEKQEYEELIEAYKTQYTNITRVLYNE